MKNEADPFRTLYEANYEQVRRLLARIVGAQEAEDLTQIVFAKAAEALPNFRGDAQASTWLFRIATNVAFDRLRSRSAHEARVTVQLGAAMGDEPSEAGASSSSLDVQVSPEQNLIQKEMGDCIRGVIAELPERYRVVLVLSDLAGLNDGEIVRILGISPGNVKVRLHRARAQLKEALQVRCDFYRNEDNEFACEPKPTSSSASQRSECSSAPRSGR